MIASEKLEDEFRKKLLDLSNSSDLNLFDDHLFHNLQIHLEELASFTGDLVDSFQIQIQILFPQTQKNL